MKKSRPAVSLAIEVDARLSDPDHVTALTSYDAEWIRTTRAALGWTSSELAAKMKVSQQSFSSLERREQDGALSIRKLRAVAEAMDCQLVYGFVPSKPMATKAIDLHSRQQDARLKRRRMPRPT